MSAIDLWWGTALALMLLMAPTMLSFAVDRRRLDGDSVWAKPLKFEFSLAIHFATLAWLAVYLPTAIVNDRIFFTAGVISVVATTFEIFYIGIQAARQRRSHFNVDTPLFALLYGLMAMGAVIITATAALVGILLLFCETPSIGAGLKIGGGVGLTGGTVLTFITAFRMGATMSRHNGQERGGATRMPFTGWSLTTADRRIPHFLATHMMQVLPAVGLILDVAFPAAVSVVVVLLCACGYAFVTLKIFRDVNRGAVMVWPRQLASLLRSS